MKKEDRELVLKDLTARLPYGVNMLFNNSHIFILHQINPNESTRKDGYGVIFDFGRTYSVNDCKPYLRPILSMTEEEIDELKRICDEDDSRDECGEIISTVYGMTVLHGEVEDVYPYNVRIEISPNLNYAVLDFLNAHHLDYRG